MRFRSSANAASSSKRPVRRVRDEQAAGSNPATRLRYDEVRGYVYDAGQRLCWAQSAATSRAAGDVLNLSNVAVKPKFHGNRSPKVGKRSRHDGSIVTRAGVAKFSALTIVLATGVKRLVSARPRTTATTWMFEESNDDRDIAHDRGGVGRILW
jgi:hypothetical protein